jgi:hypothetical protein
MAHMTERNCKNCKQPFLARTADVNRGWAKFCSKSCKAKEQDRRTGGHAREHYGPREEQHPLDAYHPFCGISLGQD